MTMMQLGSRRYCSASRCPKQSLESKLERMNRYSMRLCHQFDKIDITPKPEGLVSVFQTRRTFKGTGFEFAIP